MSSTAIRDLIGVVVRRPEVFAVLTTEVNQLQPSEPQLRLRSRVDIGQQLLGDADDVASVVDTTVIRTGERHVEIGGKAVKWPKCSGRLGVRRGSAQDPEWRVSKWGGPGLVPLC